MCYNIGLFCLKASLDKFWSIFCLIFCLNFWFNFSVDNCTCVSPSSRWRFELFLESAATASAAENYFVSQRHLQHKTIFPYCAASPTQAVVGSRKVSLVEMGSACLRRQICSWQPGGRLMRLEEFGTPATVKDIRKNGLKCFFTVFQSDPKIDPIGLNLGQDGPVWLKS